MGSEYFLKLLFQLLDMSVRATVDSIMLLN